MIEALETYVCRRTCRPGEYDLVAVAEAAHKPGELRKMQKRSKCVSDSSALSFELITGGHGDPQDVNTFSFLDVADKAVLVLELIVEQRRRFGSAGFDGGANKMRTVMAQRMSDGLL